MEAFVQNARRLTQTPYSVDSTAEASRQLIAAASQNGEHMTPASLRAPVAENAMAWGGSGVIGCRRDQSTAP